MGVCISKQDLEGILEPIKKELEPIKEGLGRLQKDMERLQKDMERLQKGMVAPEADTVARRVTVALMKYDDNLARYVVKGHGLVVKINGADYVLSAAHVLVELKDTLHIQWTAVSDDVFIEAQVDELYLDKKYIEKGSHDIGLAKINIVERGETNAGGNTLQETTLKLPSRVILGNVVVGHGSVYLRGGLVHVDKDSRRAMFQAVSVPGCSGCPLFDNTNQLIAVVHGNSKHRHHSTAAVDSASHPVFADIAKLKEYQFRKVRKRDLLILAEQLPEELAADSGTKYVLEDQEQCPEFLKEYAEKMKEDTDLNERVPNVECSWDDLMALVAGVALDDESNLYLGACTELSCWEADLDAGQDQTITHDTPKIKRMMTKQQPQ